MTPDATASPASPRGADPHAPLLAFVGPVTAFAPPARRAAPDAAVEADVRGLIETVRTGGDEALLALAERFDGVRPETLEVPRAAWGAALAALDVAVADALRDAAAAISAVHRAQVPAPITVETWAGVRITRVAEPLRRVGVYVPGGRAAYPSSVLMGVIPARVAGVAEIIVCSPPGADGRPSPAVLAACLIAGADRVFAIGGAGAIAALAFGTGNVPCVDRVVGPGNVWVTEAKRQLAGLVGIDSPAGPSEILIIADETADADAIAAELIAQAEHDPDASALLVTTAPALLESVQTRLVSRLERQPRRSIIEASLASRGALLSARDLDEALAFATEWAPEHLSLMVAEPRGAAAKVRGAGTVFLGTASSVTFGDYVTGANHVLPTGGAGRAFSGLSTLDFTRWVTHQEIDHAGAAVLAPRAATLARAEGLPGHAEAALRAASPARDSRGADEASAVADARPRPRPTLRPDYAELTTYDPGVSPCTVDLSDNTNLFGPPPGVIGALEAMSAESVTRYPSVYVHELREHFAEVNGVAAANVASGVGSDDVIDSALRAFAEPGQRLAMAVPTFGYMADLARMNGLRVVPVALQQDYSLDVDALIAARADITYVCRPNNPTGTLFDRADVERLIAHAAGIVFIDEAYVDFSGDDLAHVAVASERAIVLRTFSKAYGLAGLRLGFAIGPARLIHEIEKSRGPYKVSAAADAAAQAALARRDWVRARIGDVRENRERLIARLRASGWDVPDSASNFVLVLVPASAGGAMALAAALRERGVAVRGFAALPVVGDAIRVTVGPWPMLEQFLAAFDAVTQGGAHGSPARPQGSGSTGAMGVAEGTG